jgi:FixJ family two-component response regulator
MNESSHQPIQVFLVDDEPSVTASLKWLLESVRIPATSFDSPVAFLQAIDGFDGPACAILDLRMPDMSGLELQQALAERRCDMPLVFLTAHGDVPAAVNALQAGAIDFVQKPFNPDAFLASVRKAMRLARDRYEARVARRVIESRLQQLSAREGDVLHGLLEGRTSKEIARRLNISPKTVDVHRANVMRKMQVDSSGQLLRLLGSRMV